MRGDLCAAMCLRPEAFGEGLLGVLERAAVLEVGGDARDEDPPTQVCFGGWPVLLTSCSGGCKVWQPIFVSTPAV